MKHKINRGKNVVATKHLGGKKFAFESKLLHDNRWILPLFVLSGLKNRRSMVDTYSIAQYFMFEEIDELYEKISDDLHRYGKYVSEEKSDNFLAVLTSGMETFDNPEIVESFYRNKEGVFITKQGINEYDISKYLFHGWKERNWYPATLRAFKQMLPANFDIELFVKIFAMTSPLTHFKANITIAMKVYDLFKKNKHISTLVLPGVAKTLIDFREEKFTFSGTERNGRRKISNFARAILGDKEAVVVDSRVLEAYGLMEYYEWKGKIWQYSPRISEYDLIEKHIKLLASATGYEPRQIVSMLWSGMKIVNSKHKAVNTTAVLKEITF